MTIRTPILILALLIASCGIPTQHAPAPIVHAPAVTAPVTPAAQQTVTFTGNTVTAIDGILPIANSVNTADPARQPLITGLTNARAVAVKAVESAKATELKAEAKDGEAKAAQADLVTANRTIEKQTSTIDTLTDKVAELTKKMGEFWHSVTTWALGIGMFLSFCLIVTGVYIAMKADLSNGVAAIVSGIVGETVGVIFMNVADFFETYKLQIGIGLCVIAAGAIGFIAYLAYRKLHTTAVMGTKINQAAIVSGAVDMDKFAAIAKTFETPQLAKIVNKNTSKEDRLQAQISPNLAAAANSYTNLRPTSPEISSNTVNGPLNVVTK